MIRETWENNAVTQKPSIDGWKTTTSYRIHILIIKDDADSYSAIALNLPGAGSCGNTVDEAMENAKLAIRAVIETHVAAGEDVPWKDTSPVDIPFGALQKWIIVNA
jgi:predicted RNase H-like HicB family nuclease